MRTKGSKNTNEKVETTVILVKGNNPKWSSAKVRDYIFKNPDKFQLKKEDIPKTRKVHDIIKSYPGKIDTIQSKQLNQPWTIGLSIKYSVPAEIVSDLVEIKRLYAGDELLKDDLTVRKARWIAYLKPALMPMIMKQYPEQSYLQQLCELVLIAEQYSNQEEVSELITNEILPSIQAADTSALDDTYFIKADLSFESIINQFNPPAVLEPILGKLKITDSQIKLFNQCLILIILARLDVHFQNDLSDFIKQYPNIETLTQKWGIANKESAKILFEKDGETK